MPCLSWTNAQGDRNGPAKEVDAPGPGGKARHVAIGDLADAPCWIGSTLVCGIQRPDIKVLDAIRAVSPGVMLSATLAKCDRQDTVLIPGQMLTSSEQRGAICSSDGCKFRQVFRCQRLVGARIGNLLTIQ